MEPAISRACTFAFLLLAGGCRSSGLGTESIPGPGALSGQDPRAEIARLQEARSDGDGFLETCLADGTEPVRVLAATALGRLPFPDFGAAVTHSLEKALEDPSPRVRAAAAFAVGMRADPAASGSLGAAKADADPNVRARVVEAASRIDDPRARGLVLEALGGTPSSAREEAAVGPSRWKPDAKDAAEVDAALVRAAQGSAKEDVEVVWRALFSLARRKSPAGRSVFEAGLASPDVRARIFGAQGLRAIPPEALTLPKLRAALGDTDWRVVCEAALALGAHPEADAVPDLRKALAAPSPHVRRCAAEALAHFKGAKSEVLPLLAAAKTDASVDVRCAILVARAELGDPGDEGIVAEIEAAAGDENPLLRAGAAAAAGFLETPRAVPLLLSLSKDGNAHVADIAAHAMKDHGTAETRARLLEMLADADNGVRLAAADVLKDAATPADLPALARCMESSRGEISDEIAATIVDAAGRLSRGADGGEAARELLHRAAFSGNDHVRRKSRALILELEPGVKFTGEATRPAGGSGRANASPPGVDDVLTGPNPRVAIDTNRGTMVFELLPDEAPVHVHNFLALAGKSFYNGTTFHRIVPDFVVQGGDPRGDGNGSATFHGRPLRGEFTPRKFVRGSLGMPRNEDPDSGGCQIFVTHRETPHLDGRYTLFGEMRDGFDVLDRIEIGDRIERVRLLGAGGSSPDASR